MAARTDEGFDNLREVARLLQILVDSGEEVRIVGTSVIARSGRVGWAPDQQKWVAARYPKRR